MSTNVIRKFKKFVHTALLLSPAMWELKYRLVDLYRATMGVPHEADPRALRLFPSLVEGVFLDIGAIRGQSIRSILRMYPNARVVAFEPNLVLASKVTEEFVANAAVDVRNVALGDRNMTFCRHVPYYRRCMLDGLASLDLDHAQDWLVDSRLFFFDQRHMRVTSFDVEARTLDSLGLEPFFVKIDVQGVEPQVLMGGQETISVHQPVILMESGQHFARVRQVIGDCRYRMYSFVNGRFFEDRSGALNTFYIPASSDPCSRNGSSPSDRK